MIVASEGGCGDYHLCATYRTTRRTKVQLDIEAFIVVNNDFEDPCLGPVVQAVAIAASLDVVAK